MKIKLSNTEEALVELGHSNSLSLDQITEKILSFREWMDSGITSNNSMLDCLRSNTEPKDKI